MKRFSKKFQVLFILTIFIAGFVSISFAKLTSEQAQELKKIQTAIKEKGAKWKAGETSVFKLSKEERRNLCGLLFADRPGLGTGNESPYTLGEEPLPATFDWRTQNVVTPVKNQGSCGSCWAFASVAGMESAMLIADFDKYSVDGDLSEQLLVSCDNTNYGCCGGYMDRVYNYLMNNGTVDEECFPYYASGTCKCNTRICRSRTLSCDGKCSDYEIRILKTSDWQWVNELAEVPAVDEIKAALQQGPLPVGMDVYSDFLSYAGGIYEQTTGIREGGHAVLIVGWEDANSCWIVKNSWGTGWGEQGFFRIKWNDNSKLGMDAAVLYFDPPQCPDYDQDTYDDATCGGQDCDDTNPFVNPSATEECDGIDNNCDGVIDEGCPCTTDNDEDGYTDEACGGDDCDDTNPLVYPGATEECDGVDNNCDEVVDENCPDCLPKDDPCDYNSDCCSEKCLGKPGNKKCK